MAWRSPNLIDLCELTSQNLLFVALLKNWVERKIT